MPNILLTTYCNRTCPYCFALDAMGGEANREMTFPELVAVADMIVAAGRSRTGVLGGEPTLHPRFWDMVRYLMERGIPVTVFTNGTVPGKWMDDLDRLAREDRPRFVVNVNFPGVDPPRLRNRQDEFLRRFAPICDVGINIYRPDLDPLFLSDLIARVGLKDAKIRVGLAQPVAGQRNTYLDRREHRSVAEGIVRLAEAVFHRGMRVSLDCGFGLCSFTDDQLGRLARRQASIKFVCRPIIDIGPGLWAWSCFPLARPTRIRIDRMARLGDLAEGFERWKRDRSGAEGKPVGEKCDSCIYSEQKTCDGGCFAHRIARTNSYTHVLSTH